MIVFVPTTGRFLDWKRIVDGIASLDVLLSLSLASGAYDTTCVPVFERPLDNGSDGGHSPFVEIREGRHPILMDTFSGGEYIPNDTLLGLRDAPDGATGGKVRHDEAQVIIVTGPNMGVSTAESRYLCVVDVYRNYQKTGGKSTLMRQTGLLVLMAHLVRLWELYPIFGIQAELRALPAHFLKGAMFLPEAEICYVL